MSVSQDDKELIQLFHQEETRYKAFDLLVQKYQQPLYWHIRKIVIGHDNTNDVLQNTFVNVWMGLAHFREESKLYTWMYRIATNESLRFLEKANKIRQVSFEDKQHFLENTLRAEKGFDAEKLEWKLQIAIQKLPDKQKIVFNLRYYDEMSYQDMSEILHTSVGALKASYFHAAKKIEDYLKATLE